MIKILLAEDDENLGFMVQDNLMDLGYTVSWVKNGEEAYTEFEKQPFDICLIDVMMPKMSGYEVCERIRKSYLPSECPVIMITAKNQVQDLLEGFETGANDYLPKPFSKDELLARIKTHLNLHRIHHQTARFVPKEYFKVNDYKTIDPDGGDYNDLTSDLTSLHQTFETVFNLGTIEHIWDAHAAWSNALKLVKVGGYFVGVSPVHGYWRHGIHVTDPVAITTFIKKNVSFGL